MSKFVVGEVAIVAVSVHAEFPVGMEVPILEVHEPATQWGQYVIDRRFEGFVRVETWARDEWLRKKRPPCDDIGSWDHCYWKPPREVVA